MSNHRHVEKEIGHEGKDGVEDQRDTNELHQFGFLNDAKIKFHSGPSSDRVVYLGARDCSGLAVVHDRDVALGSVLERA